MRSSSANARSQLAERAPRGTALAALLPWLVCAHAPAGGITLSGGSAPDLERLGLVPRYASSGKNGAEKRREGDQRTPVGVYFVTGRINGRSLPDHSARVHLSER